MSKGKNKRGEVFFFWGGGEFVYLESVVVELASSTAISSV